MGLTISITNYSSVEWQQNNWGIGAGNTNGINWTDQLTQTPTQTMRANGGGTTAAAQTEHLSWLVQDALWMRLGYGSAEGNFAVELRQYFHLIGISCQDQWLYWDDTKGWNSSTADTTPYTWKFKSCLVVATPTLSSSDGSVSITISPLPKAP
jgi:hypothetical protein